MGALGCSDGPGPSSVVCANAPIDNAPDSAKTRIANLPANLFFITTSGTTTLQSCMNAKSSDQENRNCGAKRKQTNSCVFSLKGAIEEPKPAELAEVGQGWWFSAT